MRVLWLATVLIVGTLAAHSLARIGHVAGIADVVASVLIVAGLLVAHRRPGAALAGRAAPKRRLSSTML